MRTIVIACALVTAGCVSTGSVLTRQPDASFSSTDTPTELVKCITNQWQSGGVSVERSDEAGVITLAAVAFFYSKQTGAVAQISDLGEMRSVTIRSSGKVGDKRIAARALQCQVAS